MRPVGGVGLRDGAGSALLKSSRDRSRFSCRIQPGQSPDACEASKGTMRDMKKRTPHDVFIVHALALALLLLAIAAFVAENSIFEVLAGCRAESGFSVSGAPGSPAGKAQFPENADPIQSDRDATVAEGSCNVRVCDQNLQPVPGVVIRFCDAVCLQYATDAEGAISFVSPPARYNLKIVSVPQGYRFDADYEGLCDSSGEWVVIEIVKEPQCP